MSAERNDRRLLTRAPLSFDPQDILDRARVAASQEVRYLAQRLALARPLEPIESGVNAQPFAALVLAA